MRITSLKILFALGLLALTQGCGKIDGPRFWWDDRNQNRLSENYDLPPDPAAPNDYGLGPEFEAPAEPTGDDLSDDNLRDYRTNLDQEEEKRKSDSSIVNF